LFLGHHLSFIECTNVEYESVRREAFLDLQLDVRGCKDVYDSFDKLVEVKEVNYQAENHKLQVSWQPHAKRPLKLPWAKAVPANAFGMP
jgi:ubiquitin carboxyl-terminal hydrolase 7